jgi:hypothetical protein
MMKFKLISCEVIYREMCAALARAPHHIDCEFLPKALHDAGAKEMLRLLQEAIDRVDSGKYDAVLLGYGLCGTGIAGLQARALPVVIPRVHDCIGLLMGSAETYQLYFDTHSGVYFRSMGWLERAPDSGQSLLGPMKNKVATGCSLAELIERYGQDKGSYLFEQLNAYRNAYQQLTFIEIGLEPDASFEELARKEAGEHGWRFETMQGSMRMFEDLVRGDWDARDFLVLPPGSEVEACYDASIMRVKK